MKAVKARSSSMRVFTILLILSAAAFMTRIMPLSMSQYPYNNDSLSESGMASEILKYGHLKYTDGSPWFGTHSVGTPALSVLSAFSSSVLGITPLQSAQFLTAVFAVLTVGFLFLLSANFAGQVRAGIVAGLVAILLGTLVFTTGSSWREALGISLLVMLFYTFTKRSSFRFRALFFLLLGLLLITHHLVAAIGYLAVVYLLLWSWVVAISKKNVVKRHVDDAITILPLTFLAMAYYSYILTDRQTLVGSGVKIALFIASFAVLCVASFFFMSMRKHSKLTFAPLVSIGLGLFLVLDYYGLGFHYEPSATSAYLVLVAATSVIVGIAWYGSEILVETRPQYRAIQLAFFVAPFSLILFAVMVGPSVNSHQIVYRTFDFLDFFVVIGVGAAVTSLWARKRRAYVPVAVVALVCVAASFPFGYYSANLLGVRHDTQGYELDALHWIADNSEHTYIVSDERISFIAMNTVWVEKRSYLPENLLSGTALDMGNFYVLEDSWSTQGVNVYPSGLAVIPEDTMASVLHSSNVLYVGGPADDRIMVFTESPFTAAHL